jgi:membrane-bound lytic murein transglycosylase B
MTARGSFLSMIASRRAARVLGATLLGALLLVSSASSSWAKSHIRPTVAHSKEKLVKRIDKRFRVFVEGMWPEAKAHGVSRPVFDGAFAHIAFDPSVVARTEKQPEFVRPIWDYLAGAVSPQRVARGKDEAATYSTWLAKARTRYGVDGATILGIWGLETNYGAFCGGDNVIRALASLAFVRFRDDYFKGELIAALQILEEGDVAPAAMKGSWAGAMGQTQFMPSSFLKYAVDFEGHGRRDIWNSSADAIGSTANYLREHGWKADEPWGFEVVLPQDFALAAIDSSDYAPFNAFAARGVVRADGKPLPKSGDAQLLIPAGLSGPIFLTTPNFKVIKTYNNSTSYALAVALLGDQAMGGPALAGSWPIRDRALTLVQARDMQTRLKRMGYDVGKIDGKIGDAGQTALRAYQEKHGLTPDGYPTLALLERIRKEK